MYFNKFPIAANFEFAPDLTFNQAFRTAKGRCRLEVAAASNDIYHLRIEGTGWEKNGTQTRLRLPGGGKGLSGKQTELRMEHGRFILRDADGRVLLASRPGRLFGQCGEASLFEFTRDASDNFYGMGEKWSGFEHSNKTHKFWNSDVWADFHPESYAHNNPAPDPTYLSIPYLIIKRDNTYIGLLLDNPHATFISTASQSSVAGQMDIARKESVIHLGAEEGQPSLYVIHGPTLPELTRKLQTLVGVTPLPPAWSLGYQQCRWGYTSEKDLKALDRNFTKHGIPVDGLWLDIDYMRDYRVFTFNSKHFPDPPKAIAELTELDRKVVPIIDPGVKFEKGYDIYERGHAADIFCKNPQGGEYVGLVWPGETVFPDFSLKAAREWWATEVSDFASIGIQGAWLDMNEPATGASDSAQMLFKKGKLKHSAYHNQYALGMAMATREGFLRAHPDTRPFLLSRAGFTGTSRYAAIWTGDNLSNYGHLKNSIATTLNLALSGIPFNGPDAGGFGGNTTPELIKDWFKAGFLFPFFRNHSMHGSRQQEPWAFDSATLKVLRHYIRLRYRFRPYLYQLFGEQERVGEAILRPLFYDFESTPEQPLEKIDDQFMVGAHVMQAPFLEKDRKSRDVVLPGTGHWYAPDSDSWHRGGRRIEARCSENGTPLYIRDGAILPLARLGVKDHRFDGARVDFHIFIHSDATATTRYIFDDGNSFDYKSGGRSEVVLDARREQATLHIEITYASSGFGEGEFTFTTPPEIHTVFINGSRAKKCGAQGVPLSEDLKSWKA